MRDLWEVCEYKAHATAEAPIPRRDSLFGVWWIEVEQKGYLYFQINHDHSLEFHEPTPLFFGGGRAFMSVPEKFHRGFGELLRKVGQIDRV